MNRGEFQRLAELRIREAKVLLDKRLYAGAYYVAGYSVECALKACIAKQTRRHDFPDKNTATKVFTHKLDDLIKFSGLDAELRNKSANNAAFKNNWSVVKDWSEEARYISKRSRAEALDLYSAIADQQDGVLIWLRKYW